MRTLLTLLLALGYLATAHAADHEHEHLEALRKGHIDLLVLYEEDEGLHMAIAAGEHDHDHEGEVFLTRFDSHGEGDDHDHDHDYEELDHVEIVGGPKAAQAIPAGSEFAFLGEAGLFVYILPQAEIEGLPFLGLNTEELNATLFSTDPVVTLTDIEGPGDFALYQVDSFAQPIVYIDSTSETVDNVTLPIGTHVHMNWAFTAPGEYELTFEVSATLANSTLITSEPQTVHFHLVGQPTFIHEGETVVALEYYVEDGLEFVLLAGEHEHDHDHSHDYDHDHDHEHDHGEEMYLEDAVIVLGGYAFSTVPDNSDFSFLGAPGAPIYLIGQQEMEGVPYLGWDSDDLDAETFTGDPIIELHEVEGPGDLFLYSVDAFGNVTVVWNSTDAEEDVLTLPAGSHAHLNLAVTEPGTYELELHGKAVLAADSSEVEAETVLTLKAGGYEGFLGHFEAITPVWIAAETGGVLYTSEWPWLWSMTNGWVYAFGYGGPNQFYYHGMAGDWMWTSPEVFPSYWSFGDGDWFIW